MSRALAVFGSVVLATVASFAPRTGWGEESSPSAPAVNRAVQVLAKEVPWWPAANNCYSCHNNGDAARVLYVARQRGHKIDPQALADTTAWLRSPERWDAQEVEGGALGKKVATIQFGAALLELLTADPLEDRAPLKAAARLAAACQEDDGSWIVSAKGALGSPVTYGSTLATATALRVLKAAKAPEFQPHVARAEAWLRAQEPHSVLDVSATILGLSGATDEAAVRQRQHCLDLLSRAQSESGGWGPFANAPDEPFDTALAVLALASLDPSEERQTRIERGRRYLLTTQRNDGSWPETTRPSGAASYAQHMSTTAWATQALLMTEPK